MHYNFSTVRRQVFRKLERDSPLKRREAKVLEYFGNRFIWNAAFTGDAIFDDFAQALVMNGLVPAADPPKLLPAKSFLTLYAIALMHGSSILSENGDKASLHAGFVNGHTQPPRGTRGSREYVAELFASSAGYSVIKAQREVPPPAGPMVRSTRLNPLSAYQA